MFFEIQAEQSIVLIRIARELQEDILLKKTEESLSRHLNADGLDKMVQDAVLAQAATRVADDDIISIDPSDIKSRMRRRTGCCFLPKYGMEARVV